MGRLREHDYDQLTCAECMVRDPVGPCAACESMICGDCCVLTTDPEGKKGICLSCARTIATVGPRTKGKRTPARIAIAVVIVLAFAMMTLSALLR